MSKSSNFFGQPIYGQLIKSLNREKIVEFSRKHGGEKCLVRKSVDRQIQHFLVKCVKKTKNSGTNLRFRQSMPGTAAEKVSVRLTRNTILRSGHCLQ